MDPKTIVVVEDNEPIARLIREVLNEVPGYGAVALADGTFAPELIAAVRADLVILDIDLPGLGGLELYDRLRERPTTADIPVLFMSAAAHREELARRGIYDYLHKPFDLDDLLVRVERLLAEPRWGDEWPLRATGTRPE
jgi:DNA-binding response OmpR family regulator